MCCSRWWNLAADAGGHRHQHLGVKKENLSQRPADSLQAGWEWQLRLSLWGEEYGCGWCTEAWGGGRWDREHTTAPLWATADDIRGACCLPHAGERMKITRRWGWNRLPMQGGSQKVGPPHDKRQIKIPTWHPRRGRLMTLLCWHALCPSGLPLEGVNTNQSDHLL